MNLLILLVVKYYQVSSKTTQMRFWMRILRYFLPFLSLLVVAELLVLTLGAFLAVFDLCLCTLYPRGVGRFIVGRK